FNTRFKKITFPGDVLTATGEIKQVQSDGSVSVSLWTENQKGEVTAQGEALVKLLTK
ncbi:MAG: dehydratase, partial [Proteobacteria bacterium]|nr:dehydratase [Pseudomonadota bacterium]